MVALTALALVTTSVAQASVIFRLSGSTAYRAAVNNAIPHILTGCTGNYIGSNVAGANDIAFQGTLAGVTGTVTVECHWTGSLTGVVALSNPSANKYNFLAYDSAHAATITAGAQANFYSPYGLLPSAAGGYQTASSGSVTTAETDGGAGALNSDAGFADCLQSTATEVTSTAATTPSLNDTLMGVLPFAFVKGAAGTGDTDYATWQRLTNITSSNFIALWTAGSLPAQLLTGNTSDLTVSTYAVGRDEDSGTRIAAFAETGFGVSSGETQNEVTTVGGAATGPLATVSSLVTLTSTVFPTIGGGYSSGGNVANAISCQGWDAAGSGYPIAYLGAADTDTAFTEGINVTPNVTGGSTTYTASGLTGNNSGIDVIANGDPVYVDSLSTQYTTVESGSGLVYSSATISGGTGSPITGAVTVTVPSTAGIAINDVVTAASTSAITIPSGTKVTAFTPTTFTLSASASANGTAQLILTPTTGNTVTLNTALPAGTHTILVDVLPSTYKRPQFLTFNGVALSEANIVGGEYPFWEYEHYLTPSGGLTGDKATVSSALVSDIQTTDCQVAGYPLSALYYSAYGISLGKSYEGGPINFGLLEP